MKRVILALIAIGFIAALAAPRAEARIGSISKKLKALKSKIVKQPPQVKAQAVKYKRVYRYINGKATSDWVPVNQVAKPFVPVAASGKKCYQNINGKAIQKPCGTIVTKTTAVVKKTTTVVKKTTAVVKKTATQALKGLRKVRKFRR